MADQALAQTGALNSRPMTVSIIINNYNYGRFLPDSIDSALAQTYPHVEVIVVDDGSIDNSSEVIAGYGNRIIPVLKQNGGQASAFNAGFARCRGDIIFFLDSDDALLPNAAEGVVSAWRDGLALLYFPLVEIDGEGRATGRLVGGSRPCNQRIGPFAPGSPTSGNVFSRAALARAMPIPETEWRMAAESYIAHACSLLGGVEVLPSPLARYRRHGRNHSWHPPDLAETRRSIRACLKFHEVMSSVAPDKLPPLETWLEANPAHWLARIRSLREGRTDHPYQDTLPMLVWRAVNATWRNPNWNYRRRFVQTGIVLCYGTAPKAIARALKRVEQRAATPAVRFLLGRREQERLARHTQ